MRPDAGRVRIGADAVRSKTCISSLPERVVLSVAGCFPHLRQVAT
jgi:hypothetical protein